MARTTARYTVVPGLPYALSVGGLAIAKSASARAEEGPGFDIVRPVWSLHELQQHFEKSKGFPAMAWALVAPCARKRYSRARSHELRSQRGPPSVAALPTLFPAGRRVSSSRPAS